VNWRAEAACAGMDVKVFFPERHSPGPVRAAKEICGRCPVAAPCLAYALENWGSFGDCGIWGGRSGEERARLRRRAS
jgi:WhiB family redox-sensing transcriptional regulator